jgi:hypothetical protein
MRIYTGVGSRKTPAAVLTLMRQIAEKLSSMGYVLRSGRAQGADRAFESGAGARKQIFFAHHANPEAMAIAAKFHGAWHRCPEFARQLHGRNAFQVLGADLKTPAEFVICWTPDGATSHDQRSIETGGTGTAISIADFYGVPVYNLGRADHLQRLTKFVAS